MLASYGIIQMANFTGEFKFDAIKQSTKRGSFVADVSRRWA